MIAAIFEGGTELSVKDWPKPVLQKDNDVILKVTGCGICGTDMHILNPSVGQPSAKNMVLGHEFVGIVEETGSAVTNVSVGDSVLVNGRSGCGRCVKCRTGRFDLCIDLRKNPYAPGQPATIGMYSDGGMAEYVRVPDYSLYKISNKVPTTIQSLAEPLACVLNTLDKVTIRPGYDAAVFGAGPIGLMFVCMLKAYGVNRIFVSDMSDIRLEAARACGATRLVNAGKERMQDVIEKETAEGVDVSIEVVGHLLQDCIEVTKNGGNILQFGHDESAWPKVHASTILRKSLSIHGSFLDASSFVDVVRILETGMLPLDKVISHVLPISKVNEGLKLIREGKALKVIIVPDPLLK